MSNNEIKMFFFFLIYMIYCFILIELKWLFFLIFMIYCFIMLNLIKLCIYDKYILKRIIKVEYLLVFFLLFYFLNNIIYLYLCIN